MKKKIDNYTFDKTAKTIKFNDYIDIRLDGILIITNVTDNVIIYNFADPTVGGTVNNNVLTLTYNTSTMDNTDKLLIYYEDSEYITTQDFIMVVNQMLDAIANPSYADKTINALRQTIISGSLSNVSTVTSVTTVGNQTSMGGHQAQLLVIQGNDNAWSNTSGNLLS